MNNYPPGKRPHRVFRDLKYNNIYGEEWLGVYKGEIVHHNNDGPAIISYDPETRRRIEEAYYRNGMLDCCGSSTPSLVSWDDDTGIKLYEAWHNAGVLDRSGDLPAEIHYDPETGSVQEELYYSDGKLHRESGPAIIHYDSESGAVIREECYYEGQIWAGPDDRDMTP